MTLACTNCGDPLPTGGGGPRRRFCSPRCRYATRDALRSADPAWRARWRENSRRRYAALSPAERAAVIARVLARRAERSAT